MARDEHVRYFLRDFVPVYGFIKYFNTIPDSVLHPLSGENCTKSLLLACYNSLYLVAAASGLEKLITAF